MDDKYKIKVHAWDINVKIKQDKKQNVLQYMRWIYLTDSGLGGWQGGMLSRCCHLCGALALLAMVLKDILLINYHWIGMQPFKSLVFRYLHVTHTYWHKDDGWRRGGLIVRQVSLTHMQTYYFLFSDNNNNSSKQTMTNLWTTIWQIYRYITRRPWW